MANKNFNVKNGLSAGNVVIDAFSSTIVTDNLEVLGETDLGSVSNLTITGGQPDYILSTDGFGNLSWVSFSSQVGGAYVYTQASPATTWIINHNLGYQYVNIQVIDSTGNSFTGRYNYPTITFNNTTHCTVTFDSAQTGYAAVTSGGGAQGPVGPPGPIAGSNTQIIFNDDNSSNGSANLTFDKSSNTFTTYTANVNSLNATTNITAPQLISNTSNGTAPLVVSSTTLVSNLNADLLDGHNTATANTASTVAVRDSTGNISATYFIGNGSQLTGIITSVSNVSNGNSNIDIPAANGNINVTVSGNANVVVFTGTGVNIAGTLNATGNAVVSNISANIGEFTTVKGNGAELSAINGANVTGQVANALVAGAVTTNAQPNITSVGTLSSLAVTGNVAAGNLTTVGEVAATGNVSGNYIIGNGAFLTGIDATAIQNGTANVRTFNNTNVAISAAGNANVVVVTGDGANVNGTLTVTGNVSGNVFSGNGSGLSAITGANVTGAVAYATTANAVAGANVTGQVANSLVAGTVYTAAQPNITSVGTLTSLAVTGNVTAGNIITGGGSGGSITGANLISANFVTGTLTTAAQPNITSVGTLSSLSVTGNANVGNIGAINGVFTNVSGNGAALTAITGANVTGTVANATYAVSAGTADSATTAGTVTTNAQPNITSVGTLTSLAVTGNASAGNLSTGGELSVSGNAIITGNLTINGNVTYVNVDTLAVEDPIINLQTGANGAAPTSNSGKDVGTALNYYDTAARVAFMGWDVSNAEFGLASVATLTNEVVTFTTYGNLRVGNIIGNGQALTGIAGANVTGTVANATYATSAGTAGSATTAGTVTTAAQPNITSTGTLTGLTVTGNVAFSGANVSLGNSSNLKITGGSAGYFLSTDGTGNLTWANPAAGAYVYTQSVAATTWTINHNLGIQYVNIQVIDANGVSFTGRYNYPTITFNNTTHCTVTFDSAQAGYAAVTSGGGATGPQGPAGSLGGANTEIQFNDAGVANASSAFTFNKTTNTVSIGNALSVTGNANIGNLNTGRVVATGNISGTQLISNIATGTAPFVVTSTTQVANLNVATAGAAQTAGTVVLGAQPNITSVGTLTSLTVSGNISAGNVSATTFTGALSGAATTAGTVTTAAQPNITSVGTLTSLAVTGNVTVGNVIGNLANGTSDISIPASGGNINFDIGGVANVFVVGTNGSITSANLADAVGYKGIPQVSKSSQYTLALTDIGEHIDITTGGIIIPANSSVAFPIGSVVVIFNDSASTQTISITTDTLRQAGTTNTGTRTLAAYGVATLMKVAATVWVVTGNVS